ncbi:nicotinate-nucleotide--dimethylbenzimidazole phosphoribosyltransferase [Spirosoma utsteinense]|uniref:Nicotinate-nucleotide--dimethylbenzimidazole phosphoribosyltransferase n=1 Tax=Spirosoma utsteinense TaxID=2585773 RepID=A0ABR6VZK7_9BACT|nr:nicotinate-nucleotide--dimethylbenzimidazole phosphoribosyltransferase [Spirosoma utsteinense]MBC3784479.1 nicotinate-nucleotide--dimethylbenzimidazole phosphoribosyltransferase [Spirosoma utsteinense]MBC3789771.1 nicotinate-nucleotide--dimethylbenzimidazole phosphoribosyltransferase [Spirosoma utsteinense]
MNDSHLSDPLTDRIRQRIDNKTKPLGALGHLEELALQIALIQQTETPILSNPHVIVFAGDHGLAAEGISAYPASVTYSMVNNFIAGGAAINIFCRQNGLQLLVCDVGVAGTFSATSDTFVKYKIRPGTRNMRQEPAMTADECEAALDAGKTLVNGVKYRDCNIVGFGEMGIGNTSPAALLMHRMTGLPLTQCVGRGTGLDDAGLARKLSILEEIADRYAHLTEPMAVLAAMGGLEIAAIVGGMLQAAEQGMVILVDGFIATSALLVARALNPAVLTHAIFCHQSAETGHQQMLKALQVKPLLQLDLRLGEGTGCALAYPLVQAAVAMLNDMATMDSLQ